jgi:hypothetical protein
LLTAALDSGWESEGALSLLAKLGVRLMVVVLILAGFSGGASTGCWWATCRTASAASSCRRLISPPYRLWPASGSSFLPGSVVCVTFDITTLPAWSSKRAIKLIRRSGPPA